MGSPMEGLTARLGPFLRGDLDHNLGVELDEVMRRTGSAREFTEAEVPDDVLRRVLDRARFAGSGGNRQPWHVIVVRDAAIRAALRDLYAPVWDEYIEALGRGEVPFAPGSVRVPVTTTHPPYAFVDELDRVPVLLLICAELGSLAVTDNDLDRQSIVGGGSIYPFVQNVLLSATNEGLGAVLTTMLCRQEPAVRELCGIPDTHALAALVALGYVPKPITRLRRRAVEEFTTVDRMDGGVPFT